MTPVGTAVQARLADAPAQAQTTLLSRLSDNTLDPYRQFLRQHTSAKQLKFFRRGHQELARLRPGEDQR